jgi:hypothetical protein
MRGMNITIRAHKLVYELLDLMPSPYQQASLKAMLVLFLSAQGLALPECQWPRRSPHWRTGFLPTDGHRNSPLVAIESPRYWPSRGTTPFPAVASVSR